MSTIDTYRNQEQEKRHSVVVIDASPRGSALSETLRARGCSVTLVCESDAISPAMEKVPAYAIVNPALFARYDRCAFFDTYTTTGVVIFSAHSEGAERECYYERGILDYFDAEDSIEETAAALLQLMETLDDNPLYHITMIGEADENKEKFRRLIAHRRYQNCEMNTMAEAKTKWMHQGHDLPDLLLLDLTCNVDTSVLFDLIRYIRVQRLSEIPILVWLQEKDVHIRSKLYRSGVHDVLVSPLRMETLLASLTHHLDYRISKKRIRYEQSLSSQLKAMLDSSSIISKSDPQGTITYINEAFCRISGYRYEELIGRSHNIIRHPENPPLLFEQMWQTLKSKKLFRGIIRNRRKDGSNYYVDTTIAPVLDDNDRVIEYISIRHDVTQLIEKQHQLEEKRRKIQSVLDAQRSLICMVDKITGIRQANQAFMDFLGIEALTPEVCGFEHLYEIFLNIEDGFQVRHGERYIWLERLYEMRERFVKVALRDHHYNHHIFSIHVAKIPDPLFSEGICYLVTLEDVTELNRALKDTQEAIEAESRFLATMSHEIRTPLNGVLGFAELLQETPLDEEQKKYLQAIEYSGETLRQIINNILEVMKLDREEVELHYEEVNLIDELESIIFPFYALAAKKQIDLIVLIDPRLPLRVKVDTLIIKQILINLISNAIKFTASGRYVYVRIRLLAKQEEKIRVGFTVGDEGIGIKGEHKTKIFEAFKQADNSIARKYGGSGLGLSIVSKLLAVLGGQLRFKSTYGKGSVFRVAIEIACESEFHRYSCACRQMLCYHPTSLRAPRVTLFYEYFRRFACCPENIVMLTELQQVPDEPSLMLVVYRDLTSFSEINSIIKRFDKVQIVIVPAFASHTVFMPIAKANVTWLSPHLTWSSLTKELGLYHRVNHVVSKDHKAVRFKGLHILVAEDNEVNQYYIREMLAKLHISTELASDGYEAVKKFINARFDLILMDINMPNLDGITAMQQILRYEKDMALPHTPIIGLSADAVDKNISAYLTDGLDGYLVKPMSKLDLVRMLESFFAPSAERTDSAPLEEPCDDVSEHGAGIRGSLAERLELPTEIIDELMRKFIANAKILLDSLQQIHTAAELAPILHALKGIAKNLYLEPLGSQCQELEAGSETMTTHERMRAVSMIASETRSVIAEMKKELKHA